MFGLDTIFRYLLQKENTQETGSSLITRKRNIEATVEEVVRQGYQWRVRYAGTWWFARCANNVVFNKLTLNKGDIVYVVGRDNITLLVIPSLEDT